MAENDRRISGVRCADVAEKLGTPVQIFDVGQIRGRIGAFRDDFRSELFDTGVLYASKAFLCGAFAQLLAAEGMYLDVVSGGELHCALQAGFPAERMYFHGNNKSDAELEMAFEAGLGAIVVDNAYELERVIALADGRTKQMDIYFRVNPGIEAHTHSYIMTALPDSKFGTSIQDREKIGSMVRSVDGCSRLRFRGYHAHIGSQIFELKAFEQEVVAMLSFMETMEKETGIAADSLDLGGGFGVRYTGEDSPKDIGELCRFLICVCEREVVQRKLRLKTLLIEPGRSIAGEAGYTLYRVGDRKRTETKNFVFVDGGMSDNIRPALYQAKYDCENITNPEGRPVKVSVAGKCCESGDILIEEIVLPEPRTGDLLLFRTTGAYGYSMASNYNRIGRPPVVFAENGRAECVIRRERYEDMEALECRELLSL